MAAARATAPLALLVSCLLLGAAHGAFVQYTFNVSHGFWSPDCAKKMMYLVNGGYPGPVVNITTGDTVSITVNNMLYMEGTTIHWHGIKQKGTPFYDGVNMESQCPIMPGESFTYTFTVDQVGTFWWHSHDSIQKANGLYGLLVVLPKPTMNEAEHLGYDEELEHMLLNDWWHANNVQQTLGLKQRLPDPFIWVNDPQSMLINGRGIFNCSDTAGLQCLTCNTSNPQCGYPVFEVEHGKRYRIRVVNVGSLEYMNLAIEGHNVTVVQADGDYTQPVVLPNLDINVGQSYDIVITANQPVGNYWITTHVRHRATGPTGAAILRYVGAAAAYPPRSIPSAFPAWNDTAYSLAQARQIVTRTGHTERVPPADREIILVGTQGYADGYLLWAVNNQSFAGSNTPLLLEKYYGLKNFTDNGSNDNPPKTWNYTQPIYTEGISNQVESAGIVYSVPLNHTVQVILQNALALNNVSEQHPWHLHGHDFWVLGWGDGVYDPVKSPSSFNLVNPIKRNTATIYPKGWLAIRFLADNPGIWPLHCHIVFHLAMGMQVSFAVGQDHLPKLPNNFPTCGAITTDVIRGLRRRTGRHPPGKGKHPPGKGRHPPGVGGRMRGSP